MKGFPSIFLPGIAWGVLYGCVVIYLDLKTSHFGLFLNFQDDVFCFFPRWKILKIDIRCSTSERLGPVGPKCAIQNARRMNKTKKTYTFIDKRFQDGSKVSKVRILYEQKYHSRFVPGYHIFYFPQKYRNISETLKDGELKPFRNPLCQGRSTPWVWSSHPE